MIIPVLVDEIEEIWHRELLSGENNFIKLFKILGNEKTFVANLNIELANFFIIKYGFYIKSMIMNNLINIH